MNEKTFGRNVAEQSAIAFAISAASLLGFVVIGLGYGALVDFIETKKNAKTPTSTEE